MRKQELIKKMTISSVAILLAGILLTGCGGQAGASPASSGQSSSASTGNVQQTGQSSSASAGNVQQTGQSSSASTGNGQQTGGEVSGAIVNLTSDIPAAVYEYAGKTEYSGAQRFGKNLFAKSLDETNPVQSPVSAYLAITLAGVGAKGQTAEEFDAVMGVNRQALSEQFMKTLPAESEGTKVFLANSAWVDQKMNCEADWLSVAANSYRAEVFQTVLSTTDTMQAITDWVEDNTRGLIPDFLREPLSGEARLALFNTIYFKGKWVTPFEKRSTWDRTFTLGNGKEIMVPMMGQYDEVMTYVSEDVFDGVVLPYRDSDLVFVALKPTNGQTVRQLYENLDMEQIGKAVDRGRDISVDLWLPSFEVTFDKELNQDLEEMGIPTAFDRERADFTGIGYTDNDLPLYISLVRQKAVFIVDEEGTEAAAVTEVSMNECAAVQDPVLPQEVHFDHPFLYMILDKETDIPLFLGIMDDPSLAQGALD